MNVPQIEKKKKNHILRIIRDICWFSKKQRIYAKDSYLKNISQKKSSYFNNQLQKSRNLPIFIEVTYLSKKENLAIKKYLYAS